MRISDWSSDVCSSDLFVTNLRILVLVIVAKQPSAKGLRPHAHHSRRFRSGVNANAIICLCHTHTYNQIGVRLPTHIFRQRENTGPLSQKGWTDLAYYPPAAHAIVNAYAPRRRSRGDRR